MMQLDLYFPTPVWWEQTELDNTDMLKLCYQLHNDDDDGRKLSNQGGWQSKDFRPDVYAEMKPLHDMIMAQVDNCIRDYGYHEDYCTPLMENFWFNINKQGNTNSVHIHDNSFISGVYYVSANPGQGNINVYKNHMQDFIIASAAPMQSYTPISASCIAFEPMSSKLILFPGWLPHGVDRNQTEEDRVSISFNVKLVRTDDERLQSKNT
jgi:uncharacterized protein (TIGR02466 family)|tara:strand:- start:2903 stop:3529 length:627 start_codon:yes stop_codon:yes gene_type:complete